MIRFVADEHVPHALTDALLARGVEVVRVKDVGLGSTPDADILEWAAAHGWAVITFDKRTVPGFAYDRVRAGLSMAGAIVLDQTRSIGALLDELHVLAACGDPADVRDQVQFLPR